MVLKQSTHQDLVKTGLPRKDINAGNDDQISSDLAKAKEVGKKVVGRVKETITPVVNQNKDIISEKQTLFIKKIVRISIIVILLLVFLYIISLLVKTARQNGEVAVPGFPSPTVAQYLPYNPSVYAEDEMVLQLEEDIKVLDRELSTIQLKETILTPPTLDFNVNFEE
ncbi:hypothetical protein A2V80_00030 [Candidatus Woesebacteria bacterium RBG_16_39_8b]|uniref:Uncharacterized protein n=1 Tax=Candidatus Woesebacteria bacterium RBG_16_39_8b TaxID=1802482 RepID=A0A1F7XC38_9BACT|nr:MAG: hypothetical protein A2V80_00030 [Candidatus Woesebacteria bacterium RBG_16_39_8b]